MTTVKPLAKYEVVESKLFAGVVADEIIAIIRESIEERGRALVSLAGGKTPGSIYRLLGLPPRAAEVAWDKVDLFLGDERWVAPEDLQSNLRMVRETLLAQLKGKQPRVHGVAYEIGDAEKAAQHYEVEMQKVLGKEGSFDLVLLGLGEDGHTASLFPHSGLLNDASRWCAAVPHPDGSTRISSTPQVICKAKKLLYIVSGANKAGIVHRVLCEKGAIEEFPARIFTKAEGDVRWFIDSAAATKLDPVE